jgi:hypothetical protein
MGSWGGAPKYALESRQDCWTSLANLGVAINPEIWILILSYFSAIYLLFSSNNLSLYPQLPSNSWSWWSSSGHIQRDPDKVVSERVHGSDLDKYTVAYQVQFVQRTTELSFFGMTDCMQYIVSDGINPLLHAAILIVQRAAHLSQGNYMCSLYCNSMLKTEYCQMRCLWEFSLKTATRLQWDPEVTILLHSSRATCPMDIMLEETAVTKSIHIMQIPFQLLIYIEQHVNLKQF